MAVVVSWIPGKCSPFLFQQFVQTTNKHTSKPRISSPIWGESTDNRSLVDYLQYKGTVMRNASLLWRHSWWIGHPCPLMLIHDDVIKWKHFPRYWPFVRGIHRSPVNSTHKGQWRGALVFSLICVWIKGWVNNREAGELRRYRTHYDVTVMNLRTVYHKFQHIEAWKKRPPFWRRNI